MIYTLGFYLFSSILLASAFMVIFARNPVHSVLFLILAFFNTAGLFVLLGAEFLGMMLVIVYVGAVAVLFLFVVMMLNIHMSELRYKLKHHLPIGLMIGGVLFAELIIAFIGWSATDGLATAGSPIPEGVQNTLALGQVLYTKYFLLFQMSGLILLVAMIGSIVLTLRHRKGILKQNIADQVARKREESVKMVNVPLGKGV